MPNEEKIRQIAREEATRVQGFNQFSPSSVPFHVHNGTDAPYTYSPYNIYVGLIEFDGTALLMPVGWTVEEVSTGAYNITHNLGTSQYVMTVAPILSTTLPISSVVTGDNVVSVTWYDTLSSSFSSTTFQFILVQVNNGIVNVPLYNSVYA